MTRHAQLLVKTATVLLESSAYTCPSCAFQRHIALSTKRASRSSSVKQTRSLHLSIRQQIPLGRSSQHPKRATKTQHRLNGSLASSTAINPPSQVPNKYQALHESLLRLQEDAAEFVDLSRLQLALKSLESENPTLRIGFLSVGAEGAIIARKLARVLLVDSLSDEQRWERELLDSVHDSRSLLVRYGEPGDLAPSNAAMKTIHIPSAFLQNPKTNSRIEILITPFQSNLDAGQATPDDVEDTLLVPSLTIPAASGRVGFVRNPVHKSLVVAAGVDGAIQLGRLTLPVDNSLISAVVDIGATPREKKVAYPVLATLDVDSASTAADEFRTERSTGPAFSKAMFASQVFEVDKWIHNKPAIHFVELYVKSTLMAIEHGIAKAEAEQSQGEQSSTIPDATRDRLQRAISEWSADAHNDLRNNLLTVFESRAWKRTAWFRLLWRIDDVSYSTTDILNQCWLNETEQRLAFISGRINEAGLASLDQLKGSYNAEQLVNEYHRPGVRALEDGQGKRAYSLLEVQLPLLLSRLEEQSGINPLFNPPWPQTINLVRQLMLHSSVPEMHRKAQGLVLTTLSTIGTTTALGAWLWVASSGVALYEAGAIASLGLVWSLRRLQKNWSKERDGFAATVQENGRRVLFDIEQRLRELVRDGGRSTASPANATSFAKARTAVEKCHDALSSFKSP